MLLVPPPCLKCVCRSLLYELRLVQMVMVLIKITLQSCILFSKTNQGDFKKEMGSYYNFGDFCWCSVKKVQKPFGCLLHLSNLKNWEVKPPQKLVGITVAWPQNLLEIVHLWCFSFNVNPYLHQRYSGAWGLRRLRWALPEAKWAVARQSWGKAERGVAEDIYRNQLGTVHRKTGGYISLG